MLVANERFRLHQFLVILATFSVLTGLLVGLAELSRHFWAGLPLGGYTAMLLLNMYIVLTYVTADDRKVVRFFATGGSEVIVALLLTTMLSAPVLFGLLCQEIAHNMGGFSNVSAGNSMPWLGFGFDNLFEAMFLDAPAIYGLSFSTIQADDFWTQTLVLCFRTIVNLFIIKALIRYWGFLQNFLLARRL